MQFHLKILLAILFFLINFNLHLFADDNTFKNADIIILDKSSSSKYSINIQDKTRFRNLNFELLACRNYKFEKYNDQIALIRIYKNNIENFTGWFFAKTEELNFFSDKIYEISLIECKS